MKKCKITIKDEVNCRITGLADNHIKSIIKKTKLSIKGAFHTAAYQLKLTDGKESQLAEDGNTYSYMLPKLIPMIVSYGYDIDIEDNRNIVNHNNIKNIDDTFLDDYGIDLRYYQVDSVNCIIDAEKGVLDLSTSAGKTLISVCISKVYDEIYKSVIIVPTMTLVNQTYKDYELCGMDVGIISKEMNKKKRKYIFENKRHIICTWQILKNNKQYLKNFDVVIYDETHIMGDIMFSLLEEGLSHAPIRVGLTGTVPTDKNKREKIMCRIGGDVLYRADPKTLQDEGYISTVDITMIPIHHKIDFEEKEWYLEEKYLNTNKNRLKRIAEYIESIPRDNILILCQKQLANNLTNYLDYDSIDGYVSTEIRESYYKNFTKTSKYSLIATYDTVGTGTSIDDIRILILIDVGKNDTRITQGIGRGLRKDDLEDHLKVIDLYSKLYKKNEKGNYVQYSYSGGKHVSSRKKIYKKLKYPFIEEKEIHVTIK